MKKRTPWLDIHSDDRFGSRLGLAGLFGGVLGKTLFPDPDSLGILLLIIGTEEVNIVIILVVGGLLGSLGGVDGELRGCLLYTSPSPRDGLLSRMPSSA